jgi:hypothetical protein
MELRGEQPGPRGSAGGSTGGLWVGSTMVCAKEEEESCPQDKSCANQPSSQAEYQTCQGWGSSDGESHKEGIGAQQFLK